MFLEARMTLLRQIRNKESGQAMLMVLILMLVGGLILAPLLSLVSTGLKAGVAHENMMLAYYAAEAGFENAYWELFVNELEVPEGGQSALPTFTLNDKSVDVTIDNLGSSVYKITASATCADYIGITIESYLSPFSLFDNAITSLDDVYIQPNSFVDGNVYYGDQLDNKGTITGSSTNSEYDKWPLASTLSGDYWGDVVGNPYPGGASLDVKDYQYPIGPTIGPFYTDGDLEIKNTGSETKSELGGTVYVQGNLEFKQPGGTKAYTIDLCGHTIFAEGSITFPAHRVNIARSGCIIAVGDITFQPGVSSGDLNNFVFVMSIEGSVWFSPQDDFYGSVAGDVEVNLQPNVSLRHTDPYGQNLNFPIESMQSIVIRTWSVSQQ